MEYDVSDVKSVQSFLIGMKDKIDTVNGKLPEDVEKLDYDEFTESFFKANEGILKNRDAIKKEKLSLSSKLEETTTKLTDYEGKLSSLDESLPDRYNKAIDELNTLKDSIKDGAVDLDKIKARHEDEKKRLEADFSKKMQDELNAKLSEADSYKKSSETFQGMYFATLRKDSLSEDLERIHVNPEDKALIMQANLSRAEVAEDGEGGYAVFYKDDKGGLVSGQEFWDKWASSDHNQKYILADQNTGGGASGVRKSANISERDKLVKQLQETNDLKSRIVLMEKIKKLD